MKMEGENDPETGKGFHTDTDRHNIKDRDLQVGMSSVQLVKLCSKLSSCLSIILMNL